MINKEATRYFSNRQEKAVERLLGGVQTANSGAGKFQKGDVVNNAASLLIECKTAVNSQSSFRVKKEWLVKNLQEAKQSHLLNSCLAFNFGPDEENYFVIDERLMVFLVEKLIEANEV